MDITDFLNYATKDNTRLIRVSEFTETEEAVVSKSLIVEREDPEFFLYQFSRFRGLNKKRFYKHEYSFVSIHYIKERNEELRVFMYKEKNSDKIYFRDIGFKKGHKVNYIHTPNFEEIKKYQFKEITFNLQSEIIKFLEAFKD